jgi:hypothetical protein
VEVATFAAASLLHSGISIFGRVEERGFLEALCRGELARQLRSARMAFGNAKSGREWHRSFANWWELAALYLGCLSRFYKTGALNSMPTLM